MVRLRAASFIFYRVWGTVFGEFHSVGLANKAKSAADQLQSAGYAYTIGNLISCNMNPLMQETSFSGQTVLFPNSCNMDKGALAGADPPVLECGEWDTLQVGHLPSSLSETMVMPVGKSFSFTVTS